MPSRPGWPRQAENMPTPNDNAVERNSARVDGIPEFGGFGGDGDYSTMLMCFHANASKLVLGVGNKAAIPDRRPVKEMTNLRNFLHLLFRT